METARLIHTNLRLGLATGTDTDAAIRSVGITLMKGDLQDPVSLGWERRRPRRLD